MARSRTPPRFHFHLSADLSSPVSCQSSLSLELENETQIPVVLYIVYTTLYIILVYYSLESGAKHLDSNGITRAKDGRISALLHGCIVSTGLEVTTFRPSRYICINCLEGEGRGRKVE